MNLNNDFINPSLLSVYKIVARSENEKEEKAKVIDGNCWQQRYIEGETPSGLQQAEIIFCILRETNRLLLDGYCTGNIWKEQSSKKIYCLDPGLMVRRGSDASERHWYDRNENVRRRREVHYKHMHECLEQCKNTDLVLPIYCIIALDFCTDKLLLDNKSTHENGESLFTCNSLDSVLILGIAVYTSCLTKRRLNASACLRLLKGELKLSRKELLTCHTDKRVEDVADRLKCLFCAPTLPTEPSQCNSSPALFKPKKKKFECEEEEKKLSHATLTVCKS